MLRVELRDTTYPSANFLKVCCIIKHKGCFTLPVSIFSSPFEPIQDVSTVSFNVSHVSFFCGEGPRGRSYGRTAALTLIVQPCDEDEEKDDHFFHFSK